MQAYLAWGEFPVITTVSTTALPIEQLPWPSFTICNQVVDHDHDHDDDDDGSADNYDERNISTCRSVPTSLDVLFTRAEEPGQLRGCTSNSSTGDL